MYRKVNLQITGLKHEYSIDTLGVVRNDTNGKVLKGTSISKQNRYKKIHLDKFYALHILVAKHFVPNPMRLPQVNHIDGNRHNNIASNLEWISAKNNIKHAYRTGLKSNHGEKNPISKLTEDQVIQIWSMRGPNYTAQQIKDRLNLNVSLSCIKLIRNGKNWTSVTSKLG